MRDMTITKRGTTPEEKKREGAFIRRHFLAAQKESSELSQERLAGEIGVSQGLVGQWFSGKTNVPDKALILLGQRLGFDPYALRPTMSEYKPEPKTKQGRPTTPAHRELTEVLQSILSRHPQEVERLTRVLRAFYDPKA